MSFIAAWDMTTGRVGPPIASCEIKLVSWEEGEEITYHCWLAPGAYPEIRKPIFKLTIGIAN